MFERFVATLFCVLVFAVIFMVSKLREYFREKKLRELVSWSVIGDYRPALGQYSYTRELFYAIRKAQFDDSIDKKYRITEDETQYVNEIIEEFQKDTARSYFKGNLELIKSKYVVSEKDYFMMTMCCFLDNHQCDSEFIGHNMRSEIISKEGTHSTTYSLTDFGILYHKMYYITYMFCKNSKIINPSGCYYYNDKAIKEDLDSKQIKILRYY